MWKLQLLSERALFHTLDRKIKFDNICAWQMLSISKLVLNDGLILRTFMSMSMKRKQAWTEVFGMVRTSPIGRLFFPPGFTASFMRSCDSAPTSFPFWWQLYHLLTFWQISMCFLRPWIVFLVTMEQVGQTTSPRSEIARCHWVSGTAP